MAVWCPSEPRRRRAGWPRPQVFGPAVTQKKLYDDAITPIVEEVGEAACLSTLQAVSLPAFEICLMSERSVMNNMVSCSGPGGLQLHHLRLRPDGHRQDAHDAGQLRLPERREDSPHKRAHPATCQPAGARVATSALSDSAEPTTLVARPSPCLSGRPDGLCGSHPPLRPAHLPEPRARRLRVQRQGARTAVPLHFFLVFLLFIDQSDGRLRPPHLSPCRRRSWSCTTRRSPISSPPTTTSPRATPRRRASCSWRAAIPLHPHGPSLQPPARTRRLSCRHCRPARNAAGRPQGQRGGEGPRGGDGQGRPGDLLAPRAVCFRPCRNPPPTLSLLIPPQPQQRVSEAAAPRRAGAPRSAARRRPC